MVAHCVLRHVATTAAEAPLLFVRSNLGGGVVLGHRAIQYFVLCSASGDKLSQVVFRKGAINCTKLHLLACNLRYEWLATEVSRYYPTRPASSLSPAHPCVCAGWIGLYPFNDAVHDRQIHVSAGRVRRVVPYVYNYVCTGIIDVLTHRGRYVGGMTFTHPFSTPFLRGSQVVALYMELEKLQRVSIGTSRTDELKFSRSAPEKLPMQFWPWQSGGNPEGQSEWMCVRREALPSR